MIGLLGHFSICVKKNSFDIWVVMKELTLNELQQFEMEILEDVHDFCLNNNIRYSLYGGTAIGAVRHSGFIPWDDDIDIVMPRGDYERFCKMYSSKRFQLSERRGDRNTWLGFARVFDNKRTTYKSNCPWHRKAYGVWIDIFPADGYDSKDMNLYNDCVILRRKTVKARHLYRGFDLSDGFVFNMRLLVKKVLYNKIAVGKMIDRLIDKSMTYKFGEKDSWAVLCCPYDKRTIHPIDSFNEVELVKFENDTFFLLKGYDTMLKNVYGDYMQLPPVEKRVPPMKMSDRFYWKDK